MTGKNVNVLDIGVVEGGIKDCSYEVTMFMLNASNKGKTLVFPAGKYYLRYGIIADARNKISLKGEDEAIIYNNRKYSGIKVFNLLWEKESESSEITMCIEGLHVKGYTLFEYIKNALRYFVSRYFFGEGGVNDSRRIQTNR